MELRQGGTEIRCLKKHEIAASLCYRRAERFIEGYSYVEEYLSLLKKHFGDLKKLFKEGLRRQFFKLKQDVINKKCIGLILCATISDCDEHINTYYTNTNKTILLTSKNISNRLLNEYFSEEEIKQACFNTPSFHIYYNQ